MLRRDYEEQVSSLTRQLKTVSAATAQSSSSSQHQQLSTAAAGPSQQRHLPSTGALNLNVSARKFSDMTLTRALSNLNAAGDPLPSTVVSAEMSDKTDTGSTDLLNRSQSLQNILNQSHSFRKLPSSSSSSSSSAAAGLNVSMSSSQLLLYNTINHNHDPKDEVLRRWLSEKERREQLEKTNRDMFRQLRSLRETIRNYESKDSDHNQQTNQIHK